ncbi:glycerophosphodiester phosphodiesterase family protein [Alistipes ihumii]|uniref:glycerophosphodiester phosphodiesterase family protein n=1 Tax=Alistipes ihumii TaxID=1470347 RepID=UPI002666459F|nr:glycerophosphodiester phosphodiesterase family protein [Alistipes ihumii]
MIEMKIGKLFLTAVTLCSVASLQAQSGTQIVAHRGYWKTEGSAQNSIASLEKAIEIGCRGSEIDLILTTDGVLVLHHDDAIAGKRVDASTYAEIKDVKLSNGESLPTFDAFLTVARKQKGTKPIIEIKPHQTKQKEDAAVLAALDAVRRAGMNKRVEYISFSKNICEQLIANGPKGIKVAYLGGDLSPRELAERGYTGLDYHIGTMRAHEEWFDEARKFGLEINVWTVNDEGSMKYLIGKGVDYITTDEPELLQSLLGK